ncbi:MAG: DNA alkylation repair protein [Gemmatimonadetes bacterium]|nr:DNA alkylation repair protein [Gemmatimonadota bacterium]
MNVHKPTLDLTTCLAWLERHGKKRHRDQLASRFAIVTDKAFGTSMTDVKRLAKRIVKNHALAPALWVSGWHEAKALAAFVADPERVTPAMMDRWCKVMRNWADCDTVCFVLFDKTPHALAKIEQWARRRPEFERRAAFALFASVALHDKKVPDTSLIALLPLCLAAANDERNFVKKAVSWAMRAMGSRSRACHEAVLPLADELANSSDKTKRWIGKDVLEDLTRPMVTKRLELKEARRPKRR